MKKVLITGANSYIGTTFENYMQEHYPHHLQIDTLDMLEAKWRKYDFSTYDSVFHVAGLAHADVGHVSEEVKQRYYDINTKLTIEVAKKAKEEHVNQFIFMSSIIIYGESAPLRKKKVITKDTTPTPANFYGDSKLQAELGIQPLQSNGFNVVIIRPPMIYGPGCKGNYQILSKLAKKLPVFPNIKNERSMLYIDDFCEFIKSTIDEQTKGIFFPQNNEYVSTSLMVKEIAKENNKKIILTSILNPFVYLASMIPGKISVLANKAFGNLVYEHEENINSNKNKMHESTIIDNELVSIITPMFNSANFIEETIVSVINQTYTNWEMIIVDDGSNDESVEIVKKYQLKDSRIRLIINDRNSGVAKSRNIAIKASKGRYIAFLDSDDLWYKDKLNKQIDFMKSNNYGFTFTTYDVFFDGDSKVVNTYHSVESLNYTEYAQNTIIGCLTVMFDQNIVGTVIGQNGTLEDVKTWFSYLKQGHKAYGLDISLAKYRIRRGSVSNNKIKNSIEYWKCLYMHEKVGLFTSIYYLFGYGKKAIKKRLHKD
jgi:UDP-glucose 4-epimerase